MLSNDTIEVWMNANAQHETTTVDLKSGHVGSAYCRSPPTGISPKYT